MFAIRDSRDNQVIVVVDYSDNAAFLAARQCAKARGRAVVLEDTATGRCYQVAPASSLWR